MKRALFTFFLLILGSGLIKAQNIVTVQQQGSGNSASITQFNTNSSDPDCRAIPDNKISTINQIVVQSSEDTLLLSSNSRSNIISDFLFFREFNARQFGDGNNLLLVLNERAVAQSQYESSQSGSQNHITARLDDSPSNVNLSQNGGGNTIRITPCEQRGEKDSSGN